MFIWASCFSANFFSYWKKTRSSLSPWESCSIKEALDRLFVFSDLERKPKGMCILSIFTNFTITVHGCMAGKMCKFIFCNLPHDTWWCLAPMEHDFRRHDPDSFLLYHTNNHNYYKWAALPIACIKKGQPLWEYEACTHPFPLSNTWAVSGQERSLIKASVWGISF